MKIVIAGGTGFIGQELVNFFSKKNHTIYVLGRSYKEPKYGEIYLKWDGKTVGKWKNQLKKTDVLINLTGKSVNCRYTQKNKKEIIDSRVNAILTLEQAFKEIKETPSVWLNSSTATIYKHETESPSDEFSKKIGEGFSVEVAKKWEKTVDELTLNTRKIKLRITIVLGNSGGAYVPYKKMTLMGFGGKHGDGNQLFSWIHVKDLCNIIDLCIKNEKIDGIINCAAPNPITNKKFMKTLREIYTSPIGIPSPTWLLKLGAFFLGTETELLLKSRWVISTRLKKLKFHFEYDTIQKAIMNLKNSTI